MAIITALESQPPAGGTQTAKRISSYMQPTKTSTRKAGTVGEGLGSSVLKQKDGYQVQRVPLKSILKVKGSGVKATLKNEGKENKVIKSGIPVLKKVSLFVILVDVAYPLVYFDQTQSQYLVNQRRRSADILEQDIGTLKRWKRCNRLAEGE